MANDSARRNVPHKRDDGNVLAASNANEKSAVGPTLGFLPVPTRINVRFHTTALRIAAADKELFDAMHRRFIDASDVRVSQHELFSVMLMDAAERFDLLVERYKEAPRSALEERVLQAALEFARSRRQR